MSVQLQTSSASKEAPIDPQSLELLIVEHAGELAQPNDFLANVGAVLHQRSSKHKFIVLATKISASTPVNDTLAVNVAVATVWDAEKDGYHSFRVDDATDAVFMVTVYWVYVG